MKINMYCPTKYWDTVIKCIVLLESTLQRVS